MLPFTIAKAKKRGAGVAKKSGKSEKSQKRREKLGAEYWCTTTGAKVRAPSAVAAAKKLWRSDKSQLVVTVRDRGGQTWRLAASSWTEQGSSGSKFASKPRP